MTITASMVKELRERSGAGMMDGKKALTETNGDLEEAMVYLQKKGMASASKRSGRTAAEGLVAVVLNADSTVGVLIEVNSETDFVARNENFQAFVAEAAQTALDSGVADIEALSAFTRPDGQTVDTWTKSNSASIGENIQLRRMTRFEAREGIVGAYVHAGSQIGVLVEVAVSGNAAGADEFVRNVAMHAAATNPFVLSPEDIDEDARARQRDIFVGQSIESGKPADIAEKMVVGRLRKWQAEVSLLKQPYVKEPDITVEAYQKQVGGVSIKRFVRYQVGEGIEKVKSDLAAEVAAQLGQ